MSLTGRFHYYRRIFQAYLLPGKSQLTFWHETPEVNPSSRVDSLGEYYMPFTAKADYAGHYDVHGIPMLDYRGAIGLQYNPIAVAQWGLGNFNLFRRSGDTVRLRKFMNCADWLTKNLEPNSHGLYVWNHHFDWEYRDTLRAPWYSGLAQGQGISVLLRAHQHTLKAEFLEAARRAFEAFMKPVDRGGVAFTDSRGDLWFEEYIVDPPTHILNGFIWAMWGVYDYFLATGDTVAKGLLARAVQTLKNNLARYDTGFWSLYEQSGTRLPMLASPFYHHLHIVQLRVMQRLSGDVLFAEFADRWERYGRSRWGRARAVCYKSVFKLCHY